MRFQFFHFKSALASHRYNRTKAVFDFSKFCFSFFIALAWLYFDLNAYQRDVDAHLNGGKMPSDVVLDRLVHFSCGATLLLIMGNLLEWHLNKDRLLQRRLTPTLPNCIKSIPSILFITSQLFSPFMLLFSPILFSEEITVVDVQSSAFKEECGGISREY